MDEPDGAPDEPGRNGGKQDNGSRQRTVAVAVDQVGDRDEQQPQPGDRRDGGDEDGGGAERRGTVGNPDARDMGSAPRRARGGGRSRRPRLRGERDPPAQHRAGQREAGEHQRP